MYISIVGVFLCRFTEYTLKQRLLLVRTTVYLCGVSERRHHEQLVNWKALKNKSYERTIDIPVLEEKRNLSSVDLCKALAVEF